MLNLYPPVLVIGADGPTGLTVIRELGEQGVPVFVHARATHALSRYSRHTRGFISAPDPLASWLPQYVADHAIAAVMAISERHLLELTDLAGRLGESKVLTPDSERLALVLDKPRTLEAAARIGISVPSSWLPEAGEDFADRASALSYPVAIKWPDPNAILAALQAQGLCVEKVEYASGADQLLAILRRYDCVGAWPMVQSWCPGYGMGQMLHMRQRTATLRFQHRRLREWPPSGGFASFCEAVPHDRHRAQMALSEGLLRELGWEGAAMVEYRHDPVTGTYWLMEVNGRFWGSMPLAYHCGAHFAWETYRSAILGEPGDGRQKLRLRRARYAAPDLKHFGAIMRDRDRPIGQRLHFAAGFLAAFLDPRVRYYVWSLRDPLPFFADMWSIFRRIVRWERRGKAA